MVKLEYNLQGNLKSKQMVVFLQGWPDNHQMWEWINWREDLSDYLLLFIDFPNTNGKVTHKWGVDFAEIVQGIKQVVDSIPDVNKKILVAHDWGCVYAYMFDQQNPNYFNNLIVMDVPPIPQVKTLKALGFILFYQIYLIIAFLIGGWIGTFLTQKMATIFKHNPPYLKQITSYQNYPYYYFYKNKIVSLFNKEKSMIKKGYRPSVPTVYLFGKIKPFQFHGAKWEKWIEDNKQKGCEMHGLEYNHWFMKKFPKFITELIIRRLK